jgi:hypothetical protein
MFARAADLSNWTRPGNCAPRGVRDDTRGDYRSAWTWRSSAVQSRTKTAIGSS